jgi:hypothetical protein
MIDASIVADPFGVCLTSHMVNYLPVKSSRLWFPNLESEGCLWLASQANNWTVRLVQPSVVVVPMADGGEVSSSSLCLPVKFDGVLGHLLVGIEFRAM